MAAETDTAFTLTKQDLLANVRRKHPDLAGTDDDELFRALTNKFPEVSTKIDPASIRPAKLTKPLVLERVRRKHPELRYTDDGELYTALTNKFPEVGQEIEPPPAPPAPSAFERLKAAVAGKTKEATTTAADAWQAGMGGRERPADTMRALPRDLALMAPGAIAAVKRVPGQMVDQGRAINEKSALLRQAAGENLGEAWRKLKEAVGGRLAGLRKPPEEAAAGTREPTQLAPVRSALDMAAGAGRALTRAGQRISADEGPVELRVVREIAGGTAAGLDAAAGTAKALGAAEAWEKIKDLVNPSGSAQRERVRNLKRSAALMAEAREGQAPGPGEQWLVQGGPRKPDIKTAVKETLGTAQGRREMLPLVGGVDKAMERLDREQAAARLAANGYRQTAFDQRPPNVQRAEDQRLVEDAELEDARQAGADPTRGYRIAKGAAAQVPYVLDFAITGGLYNKAAQQTAGAIASRLAKTLGPKVAQTAGKLAGSLAGTAARTAADPAGVIESSLQERQPVSVFVEGPDGKPMLAKTGEPSPWFNSVVQGWFDKYIENLGELAGDPARAAVNKAMASPRVLATLKAVPGATKVQAMRQAFGDRYLTGRAVQALKKGLTSAAKATGWQGLPYETGEETLTATLKAALGVKQDPSKNWWERMHAAVAPGWEPFLEQTATLMIPGMGRAALTAGAVGIDRARGGPAKRQAAEKAQKSGQAAMDELNDWVAGVVDRAIEERQAKAKESIPGPQESEAGAAAGAGKAAAPEGKTEIEKPQGPDLAPVAGEPQPGARPSPVVGPVPAVAMEGEGEEEGARVEGQGEEKAARPELMTPEERAAVVRIAKPDYDASRPLRSIEQAEELRARIGQLKGQLRGASGTTRRARLSLLGESERALAAIQYNQALADENSRRTLNIGDRVWTSSNEITAEVGKDYEKASNAPMTVVKVNPKTVKVKSDSGVEFTVPRSSVVPSNYVREGDRYVFKGQAVKAPEPPPVVPPAEKGPAGSPVRGEEQGGQVGAEGEITAETAAEMLGLQDDEPMPTILGSGKYLTIGLHRMTRKRWAEIQSVATQNGWEDGQLIEHNDGTVEPGLRRASTLDEQGEKAAEAGQEGVGGGIIAGEEGGVQDEGERNTGAERGGSDVGGPAEVPGGVGAGTAGEPAGERGPGEGPGPGGAAGVEGGGEAGETGVAPGRGPGTRPPRRGGGAGGAAAGGGTAAGVESGSAEEAGGAQEGERPGGVEAAPAPAGKPKQKARPTDVNARNYRIAADEELIPGGDVMKVRGNMDAIRLLKDLERADRNATPEEKKTLARYVGWGGLPQVFDRRNDPDDYSYDENYAKKWGKFWKALKDELTEEEYRAARASTINAHYTEKSVIEKMWSLAEHLGFDGGRVGEFGAGIGHFMGLVPDAIEGSTRFTAVELDEITGRMLKKLYPEATVHVAGLEKTRLPPNGLEMVIGNFPFAKEGPYDSNYPKLSLHNYFFARAVDAVKPGGLVVAITSSSTMDNEASAKAREMLGEKADLVGAIRLPNTTFLKNAGTKVTTDIIVLRKRGVKPFPEAQAWRDSRPMTTADGKHETPVNEYYGEHPDMMLGLLLLDEGQYRENEPGLAPKSGQNLVEDMTAAIEKLPAKVMGVEKMAPTTSAEMEGEAAGEGQKEYEFVLGEDGSVYQVVDGKLSKTNWNDTQEGRGKSYIQVRDKLRDLRRMQLSEEATDEGLAAARKELNRLYDAHVKDHGIFSDPRGSRHKFLEEDPEFRLVTATEDVKIETVKGPGGIEQRRVSYVKGAIYRERTQWPWRAPARADTVEEAALISRAYQGAIDLDYIGQLTGKDRETVHDELLHTGKYFEDPASGNVLSGSEYLSGNVREKLAAAELAAEDTEIYAPNVEALKKVQPAPKEIGDIEVTLGATWIPEKTVTDWLRQLFEDDYIEARMVEATGDWVLAETRIAEFSPANRTRWATTDVTGLQIIRSSLNLQRVKVYDEWTDPDGTKHRQLNKEKSLVAQEKQAKLEEEFSKWVKTTPAAGQPTAEAYNTQMNAHVDRTWDEDQPVFEVYPGAAKVVEGKEYVLRPHQRAAIARGIEDGRALFAHAVASGKTGVLTTLAMELKRLGLARKSMVVVQNQTISQFGQFIPNLYPQARVLVVTDKDLQKENRKRFMGRIASGDWDIVVVAHSQFDRLPNDPAVIRQYMDRILFELEEAIQEATQREGKKGPSVKSIEKQKKAFEARMQKLLDRKVDDTIFFEDLGIDALMVDEAHLYKKNPFVTKMDRVKGLDVGFSQIGMGLALKTQHVQEKTGGRNVFLSTGTPITNTLAEIWNMLRFTSPQTLAAWGVDTFDRFASTFTTTAMEAETDAAGRYRMVTRFSKFRNVPELGRLIRTVSDVRMSEDLPNLPKPPLKGGKAQMIDVEPSPQLVAYTQYLNDLYEWFEGLSGQHRKEMSYIPATIYTMARQSTIDIRLVWPQAKDEPGSKLNVAAETIFDRWKEYAPVKGAQAVFLDMRRSKWNPGFDAWAEIKRKLIEKGIPEKEIVTLGEIKNKKALPDLWDRVRSGDVRVVIGSTSRMGIGVNIQDRLAVLHALDSPLRPDLIEQREGRILRQGNTIAEVEIIRYGVTGTLDAGLYQLNARKQKMINQALRGDIKESSIADPGGAISFQEAAAFLSGNPDLVKKTELDLKLKSLEALEREWERSLTARTAEKQLELTKSGRYAAVVKEMEKNRAEYENWRAAAVDRLQWGAGDDIKGDQDAIEKALDSRLKDLLRKTIADATAMATERPILPFTIKIAGHTVQLMPYVRIGHLAGKNQVLEDTARIDWSSLKIPGAELQGQITTGRGLLTSMEGAFKKVGQKIKEKDETAKRHAAHVKEIEQYLKQPFEQEAELVRVRREREELEDRLLAGGQATVAKAPRQNRPAVSEYLRGAEDEIDQANPGADVDEDAGGEDVDDDGEAPAAAGEGEEVSADLAGPAPRRSRRSGTARTVVVSTDATEEPVEATKGLTPEVNETEKPPAPAEGEPAAETERTAEGVAIEDDNTASGLVLELPELVDMARSLLGGKTPKVMRSLRAMRGTALGLFRANPLTGGEIELAAGIFETVPEERRAELMEEAKRLAKEEGRDPVKTYKALLVEERQKPEFDTAIQARKTLAHEIGHAVDWLSDRQSGRGNILGHIASLHDYIKKMLGETPAAQAALFSPRERDRIHRQAVRDVGDKKDKAAIAARYKELLQEAAEQRGLVTRDEVMEELKALAQWWKPFDRDADQAFTAYRESPSELYADAISVMLNNPAALKKRAPKFTKAFWGWIEKKPDFRRAYERLQDEISSGKIYADRVKRLREGFRLGAATEAELAEKDQQPFKQLYLGLRQGFLDLQDPALAPVRRIGEQDLVAAANPRYAIESMLYAGSSDEWYLNEVNANVLSKLDKTRLGVEDLGEYMFHKRVTGERAGKANPEGFDPRASRRRLEEMAKTWGAERMRALEAARQALYELRRQAVIEPLREANIFHKDLMEYIEDNENYATFDVVEHLAGRYGRAMAPHIYRQIGTLKAIKNPFIATIQRDLSLMHSALRHNAKKTWIEFMRRHVPDEIEEAREVWVAAVGSRPGHHEAVESRDPDKKLMGYMSEGKFRGFYVSKAVADGFNYSDPTWLRLLGKALMQLVNPIRTLYTDANPGFWESNAFRDFWASVRHLPGASVLLGKQRFLPDYVRAIVPAFRSIFGMPDATVQEMLRENMLISKGNPRGGYDEDADLERTIIRAHIKPATRIPLLVRPLEMIGGAWDGFVGVGQAIERIPKIAAYRYLRKHYPDLTEEEIAHIVRRTGSPMFLRKGAAYALYNSVFLFSNAAKEGLRAEWRISPLARKGAKFKHESKSEWWYKTFMYVVLPKMAMWAATLGLVDAGVKFVARKFFWRPDEDEDEKRRKGQLREVTLQELYMLIPEYDMNNYLCVPVGLTPEGKCVYFRFPTDEQGRMMGNLVMRVFGEIEVDGKKMNAKGGLPLDIASYFAGEIPNLNPAIMLGIGVGQAMSGRNPYDWYRGTTWLSDKVWDAQDGRTVKELFKKMANQAGAGVIYRFSAKDPKDVKGELEEYLDLPLAQNMVGRFVKVSDRGIGDAARQEKGEVRKENARLSLDADEVVSKVVGGEPLTARELEVVLPAKGKYIKEHVEALGERYGNRWMREIMDADSTAERAALIQRMMEWEAQAKGQAKKKP